MGTRDLEIARAVKLRPVEQVAETLGLDPDDLEPYGTYKAKVRWKAIERSRVRPDGALVLVTAMTPTPAGEGKSTIAIGLADGLRKLGSRSIVALRQPALGPVFGAKGGATGGGRAQVAPMEEINLHFTGDIHAVGAAHNLLAAMVDNHLVQGDALALDSRKIFWKRVVDMNDRALRNVIVGLGGPAHGVPRESGFEITEASELMAILSPRLGLKLAEVVVTEAGFATDLGAEKFVDIKCRTGGLVPACAVVVATVRAVKVHGLENLAKHVQNVRRFGLAPVVALNRFATDPDAEVAAILEACRAMGARAEEVRAWELGGAGATGLAQAVLDAVRSAAPAALRYLYQDDWTLEKKIETIATEIYGADGVLLMPAAATKLEHWQAAGYGRLAVCMAKTQNSLSDDAKKPGRPRGFTVSVREAKLAAGAGFVIAYTGDILTMPGLPRVPGAESIDIDLDGNIVGLF